MSIRYEINSLCGEQTTSSKHSTILGIPINELSQEELVVVCEFLGRECTRSREECYEYAKHKFDYFKIYGCQPCGKEGGKE